MCVYLVTSSDLVCLTDRSVKTFVLVINEVHSCSVVRNSG